MTQVLPDSDTFDHGSPVYGASVLQYLGIEMADANYLPGTMHSGYQGFNSGGGFQATNCAVTGADSSATHTTPRGFMRRREGPEDVIVSLDAYIGSVSGRPRHHHVTEFGVMARIQGGTLTDDGTTDVRYVDADGYQFKVSADPGPQTLTFALVRYNSGTETVLDSTTVLANFASQLDFGKPFTMLLTCTGSGTVTLDGSVIGLDHTKTGQIISSSILSATDSTGSRITGTGRCGFTCGRDRSITFPQSAELVDVVQKFVVMDSTFPTSGSMHALDEFKRNFLEATTQTAADVHGNQGYYLAGDYLFDQFTNEGTGGETVVDRLGATERVIVTPSSGSEVLSYPMLSQRVASDDKFQHRSVDAEIVSTTGSSPAARAVGIVLRAALPSAVNDADELVGYVAEAAMESTETVYKVKLWRYEGGAPVTRTLLASYTGSSGSPFALDLAFDLDFDIYPQDGHPDPSTAPAVMKVSVDSTQVVLVAESVAGVTASGAGTVTDASNDRITSGYGEGLWYYSDNGTKPAYFDNWNQETLHSPVEPVEDVENMTVSDEGTASGTINDTLTHDWSFRVDEESPVLVDPYDSGHQSTRSVQVYDNGDPVTRRTFFFHNGTCTETEYEGLETFFDDHDGVEDAFTFTTPSGEDVKVCYESDSLLRGKRAHETFTARFTLLELI